MGNTDPFTHGGDGNDYIDGGASGDILLGEEGDDYIVGGNDQDLMQGGQGDVKHWAFNDPPKRAGEWTETPPPPEITKPSRLAS